ncbi:hypothetical protein [Arthrobacter sp. GMC3]|uniref:hypothetical protein n=1 Tax=Arthrobacter sp. GMC3 TaxID=2058894 RepID=UPI000CE506B8|nr:hypothetical protein [Arthrobacter sp. GMC3]
MSLEEEIRELVLDLEGVSTVYSADPLWLNVLKQVGALLLPDDQSAEAPFVVCRLDSDAQRPVMTVQIRIGTDSQVPAPALARNVAAAIREFVSSRLPETDVVAAVEIAAIGL